MSTIIKCDRCNDEVVGGVAWSLVTSSLKMAGSMRTAKPDKQFDLCRSCYDGLGNFLGGGEPT